MAKKILLADDSLTIQKVVELTFSDSDYDLVCVSNGQKALDRLQDDRPDLVLADAVMPEKNGYEVCEAIKGNPATARIPVLLLSGTFEPFDRERAERIGADAIVSKPFDSQQLIAQVEALLDRRPVSGADGSSSSAASQTARVPITSAAATPGSEQEEPPFDVGFSAEDFTASVRIPSRGLDPFEEEYGRGDVDSAIEAFERSRPQPASGSGADTSGLPSSETTPIAASGDAGREPLTKWLADEPEKATQPFPLGPEPEGAAPDVDSEATVALRGLVPPPDIGAGDAAPAAGAGTGTRPRTRTEDEVELPLSESLEMTGESQESGRLIEIEEQTPRITLEPPAVEEGPSRTVETVPAPFAPATPPAAAMADVSHEIEMLAQTSSIPELTQMLSSVARSVGGDLSDDQIEKLARRVVEKLSDRIVREIAWEVIPDMAEIVIKQRIKELESGAE